VGGLKKLQGFIRARIRRKHVNRAFDRTDPPNSADPFVSVPIGANQNQDSFERSQRKSEFATYPNPRILNKPGLVSVDPSNSVSCPSKFQKSKHQNDLMAIFDSRQTLTVGVSKIKSSNISYFELLSST